MAHWAFVKLAVTMRLPAGFRDRLWAHIDRCPSCQARLAGREETRRLLVQASDVGRLDRIWPAVRKSIRGIDRNAPETFSLRSAGRAGGDRISRWAAAAAGVGIAAFLTVSAVRYLRGIPEAASGGARSENAIQIHYAWIGGRPADTFIVKPPDAGFIVVWVEKRSDQGGEP